MLHDIHTKDVELFEDNVLRNAVHFSSCLYFWYGITQGFEMKK